MGKNSPYYLRLHPEIVEVEPFYEKYFLQRRHGIGILHGKVWGDMQDGVYVRHPDKSLGFYYQREFTAISEEEYSATLQAEEEKRVAEEVVALYRIANDAHLYQYRARVLRVVDGDTYDLMIDLGFETFIQKRIRLYGVNTPEIKGDDKERGLQARDRVVQLIHGKEVMVVSCDHKGKYGRPLAKILMLDRNRQDLGDLLVAEKLGVEEYYD